MMADRAVSALAEEDAPKVAKVLKGVAEFFREFKEKE